MLARVTALVLLVPAAIVSASSAYTQGSVATGTGSTGTGGQPGNGTHKLKAAVVTRSNAAIM
uniref:Uncharacterized protein n=1 Tax=Moniliophthora roreri TaxID=221103 RepID=A0A0W0GE16_MONRR